MIDTQFEKDKECYMQGKDYKEGSIGTTYKSPCIRELENKYGPKWSEEFRGTHYIISNPFGAKKEFDTAWDNLPQEEKDRLTKWEVGPAIGNVRSLCSLYAPERM